MYCKAVSLDPSLVYKTPVQIVSVQALCILQMHRAILDLVIPSIKNVDTFNVISFPYVL